jgi:hypothetical protein
MPHERLNLSEIANRIGFLTCTEFEGWGLCGGLLLLNQLARPLEFHCTLPVKVSRTQEILYGRGLRSHVCGQVIGKALVEKPKTPPQLIVTDCPNTASVYRECPIPVVLMPLEPIESSGATPPELATSDPFWEAVSIGSRALRIALTTPTDGSVTLSLICQALTKFSVHNDLAEPLERVRQAISEARDAATRAA